MVIQALGGRAGRNSRGLLRCVNRVALGGLGCVFDVVFSRIVMDLRRLSCGLETENCVLTSQSFRNAAVKLQTSSVLR